MNLKEAIEIYNAPHDHKFPLARDAAARVIADAYLGELSEVCQVCDELIKSIRERYQVPPDQELDCEHLRKLESLLKKSKPEASYVVWSKH